MQSMATAISYRTWTGKDTIIDMSVRRYKHRPELKPLKRLWKSVGNALSRLENQT